MQKGKILNTIQRYLLNEPQGSVKWSVTNDEATIHFLTQDKSCRGIVQQKGVELEDGVFGIYDTPKFKQVFGALDNDVVLEYHTNHGMQTALYIKDSTITVDYLLSSLDVLFNEQDPDPEIARPLKAVPNPNVVFNITSDFVNRFVKSKNALPDAQIFAVTAASNIGGAGETATCEFIINYSTHPTNQIRIPVSCTVNVDMDLVAFNADTFKEILLANRDFTRAEIKVYHIYDSVLGRTKGMIESEFWGEDWHSIYRLNKIELV